MQFNTFVATPADLKGAEQAASLHEVLLEPTDLARQGRLSQAETAQLADLARQAELRPVLVWDILLSERVIADLDAVLSGWSLDKFAAVRVSDIGAALWLQEHYPDLPLQLIVETGNHNIEALNGWCDLFADTLERLVLSIELPEAKLIEYCRTLPVGCEVMGVGQILLFYSPRSLLARPLDSGEDSDLVWLEATATSEKSSFKPFPTLETKHGTMMFLDKDQFILDRFGPLQAAGLHTLRLDLRHLGQGHDVAVEVDQLCQQVLSDPQSVRQSWPNKIRAPFFKANKTTAQFSRIRSRTHQYRDQHALAEVIAGERGQYVVFQALRPFELDSARQILLPNAQPLPLPIDFPAHTPLGEPIQSVETSDLLITPWFKKACTGALLLRSSLAD